MPNTIAKKRAKKVVARGTPQVGSHLDVRQRPVISAEEAFRLLDIDRTTGYKAIRDGTFPVPVFRIGRAIRVPTAALLRLLNPSESHDEGETP
jgi:predicted DNA-binding transcriptional regulator AlpA